MKPIFILAVCLFALLSPMAFADTSIDATQNNRTIGEHIDFYEDAGSRMTLEDIIRLPDNAFKPLGKKIDSHLFTLSAYWYRFDVHNPTILPLDRVIFFEIPWLDDITVHVLNPNGTLSDYRGGDTFDYNIRSYSSNFSNFEHQFLPGSSTVYVRVQTRDPFIVPISISERRDFLEFDASEWGTIAFLYGMLAAMIFYNLFLYFSIKSRYYFYYVLYITFFIAMNTSYKCYTFGWFFEDDPILQNWMESTMIYLFSITGLLFTQSFLGLKEYYPKLYRLTNGVVLFYIAVMISLFFTDYHYHVAVSIMLAAFFSLYAFSIGIYTLSQGHRFALFFIVGTSAGLAGAAVTALTVMALIPYHEAFFHCVDYGIVIDSILLSLALGERVKNVQKEKVEALLLAKTDPLTTLPNRRAYNETASLETSRSNRYDTPLSLIFIDIDHFKSINDTYGHAAGDVVLKEIAYTIKTIIRENDHAFRMGGEEFVLLLPNTAIAEAYHLAERIRIAIHEKAFEYEYMELKVNVSIGVSEYIFNEPIEETEKRADDCLYRAKKSGRNCTISDPCTND